MSDLGKCSSWLSTAGQLIVLLLVLLGIALAGERRITVVETRMYVMEEAVQELKEISAKMDSRLALQGDALIKAVTILDILYKERADSKER